MDEREIIYFFLKKWVISLIDLWFVFFFWFLRNVINDCGFLKIDLV